MLTIRPMRSHPTSFKRLKLHKQRPSFVKRVALPLPTRIPAPQEPTETDNAKRDINRHLALTTSSLGLIAAGAVYFPPLTLAGLPMLLAGLKPFYQQTKDALASNKQRGLVLIDILSVGGSLVTGHLFAAALAASFANLSRKLLIHTEDHSRKGLVEVFGERPERVWVQQAAGDGNDKTIEVQIPFDALQVGDTVIIDAGQAVPIDGTIIAGVGTVDQRALTGESQPVEKLTGEMVMASTILLSGRLLIEVEKTGEDTAAAQISQILNASDDFKSSILSRGQTIVERGAMPTLALSALALPFLGASSALAILYASFGYNMKLAAPIGVLNFLRITSDNGILVKDGRSLELLSQVDTIVFDKTGTLTEDEPTVGRIYACMGLREDELLSYAAAAEQKQPHPIARAILKEAGLRELRLPAVDSAEYELGYGLKVHITTENGRQKTVRVGSARFMELCHLEIPSDCRALETDDQSEGGTFIYVALGSYVIGSIELVPTIRPEAYEISAELRKRNIQTVIISGDHQKPTANLATKLGIDNYFAEVLPQDKAQLVEQLQAEGCSVCFIGDGINDSIALKTAQVGISLSGASTAATDTAGIILMDGTLKRLIDLLDTAHDLDINLTRSQLLSTVPGVIAMGGVFFLNLGLVGSIMLFNVALVSSISNAFLPMFQHRRRQAQLTGNQ